MHAKTFYLGLKRIIIFGFLLTSGVDCTRESNPSVMNSEISQDNATSDEAPLQIDYAKLVQQRRTGDHRLYREVSLENGLKVILVQDSRNNEAYASMNVGVGSLAEPREKRGLAHFLEHLLFLGSEKFPDVDAYNRYLSDNSGGSNAFTSRTDTNYFFSVSGVGFEGALDRFSQFFIAPLLDEKYVEREKDAIEKEYMRILENDSWRDFRATMLAMNPEHPHSWYFPGSLQSLAGVNREDALEFYNQYYSASNMQLALIGPQDLDTLESWARIYFTGIKNNGTTAHQVSQSPFEGVTLPQRIEAQSFSQTHQFAVNFILPFDKDEESKSLNIIGSILGTEVEGSLTSYLKEAGLILSLSAGGGASESYNSLSVSVRLTPLGQQNKQMVVDAISDYIRLMQQVGIPDYELQRQQDRSVKSYLEAPYQSSSDFATELSLGLKEYPGEDAFAKATLIQKVDRQKLRQILKSLTPAKVLITDLNPRVTGPSIDPDYRLRYQKGQISPGDLQRLIDHSGQLNPQLRLPRLNPYIATSSELITQAQQSQLEQLNAAPGFNSFVMQDVEFSIPEVRVDLRFHQPIDPKNVRAQAIRELTRLTLEAALNELTYEAFEAGIRTEINANHTGLQLTIRGPGDRMESYIDDLLKRASLPIQSQAYLTIAKEKLDLEVLNLSSQNPLDKAFTIFDLNIGQSAPKDLMQAEGSNIDLATINAEFRSLAFESYVEMAILGNVTPELAQSLSRNVQDLLVSDQSLPSRPTPGPFILPKAQPDQHALVQKTALSDNSGFLYWFTLEGLSPAEVGALEVVSSFVGQQYFTEMRTEKGLAYAVGGGAAVFQEDALIYFYMQSDSSVERLHHETLSWLPTLLERLRSLTAEDYINMREALLISLRNPPQSHEQKWNRVVSEWTLRPGRLSRQARITAVEMAELSSFTEVILKMESSLQKSSVTVGVWPEAQGVGLIDGLVPVGPILY